MGVIIDDLRKKTFHEAILTMNCFVRDLQFFTTVQDDLLTKFMFNIWHVKQILVNQCSGSDRRLELYGKNDLLAQACFRSCDASEAVS
jgi:hypothetical protein